MSQPNQRRSSPARIFVPILLLILLVLAVVYHNQSFTRAGSTGTAATKAAVTSTPGPNPTPTRTAAPTATPKPTAVPTPQPTAVHSASDGMYHYQLFRYYCLKHGQWRERVNGNMVSLMRQNSADDANDPAISALRKFLVAGSGWEDRMTRYPSYHEAVNALLPYLDDGSCQWVRMWTYVMTPDPLMEEADDSETAEFGHMYLYTGAKWHGQCIKTPEQSTPSFYLNDYSDYSRLLSGGLKVWSFAGHRYQIMTGADTWEDAADLCIRSGGHLADISSAAENAFLYAIMKSSGLYEAYFGLTDAAKESQWKWNSGATITYTNWHDGEPNGGTYENYGMFYLTMYDATWNDGNFLPYHSFICEWDP